MSISSGIKFFERSKCLLQDGTLITASSGDAASTRCIDRNPISYWRSIGSNDLTTETLEIELMGSVTLDRILLLDHNFKSFNIKYYSGGMYVHFASVYGINGSMSNLTETVFAQDSAYYEFTQVTTTKLLITINSTQVANAEKYISQVVATTELGTLVGHPVIKGTTLSREIRNEKMLSGRVLSLKSEETFECSLDFKDYPNSLSADIDLIFSLYDRDQNFIIWLCGGKYGTNNFRKQLRGYRLRDAIPVQVTNDIKPIYSDNVFVNSVNFSVKFEEAVDL